VSGNKIDYRGYLYLLTAVALWSTAEVVTRSINDLISPLQFAWVRCCIATVLLMLIFPFEMRRKKLKITRKILWQAMYMSLLGIVLSAITYQFALVYAGASIVATIYGIMPIMVFILARIVLGDPLSADRMLGVLLGFAGILVLSMSKESETFSLLGVGIMVLNIFIFSLFTVLVKKHAKEFAGIPFTTLCFIFGFFWMTPLVCFEWDTRGWDNIAQIWMQLLYVGIFTTGVAFVLYLTALERIDATGASSIILLKPPFAILLAHFALGEELTWNVAVATAFITSGLLLVNMFHYLKVEKEITDA